ncbi:MAG: class I SAM-dependent methyltransferase [Myxococcales bacterium]|nr:class I SAM-dependent methyltransferase [Myxococcales bacterium]
MTNRLAERLLEQPLVYRLWQAPFVRAKLAPVLAEVDLASVRRVLDLGCGPGTNAPVFAEIDYLGVDINPDYIANARRRFGREFVAADIRTFRVPERERFDFVLLNSFLHHIDDANTVKILESAREALTPDGRVHILDLVLPARPSIARTLARLDRGDHPRLLERWRELFTQVFEPEHFEPYPLALGPVTLWNMVYFRGRRR